MIEIAGLTTSELLHLGIFGILLVFAMKFGLTFVAFGASAGLVEPLLVATPIPYPIGFKAGVVLVLIAFWLEYIARNTLVPTEPPEDDDFNHGRNPPRIRGGS